MKVHLTPFQIKQKKEMWRGKKGNSTVTMDNKREKGNVKVSPCLLKNLQAFCIDVVQKRIPFLSLLQLLPFLLLPPHCSCSNLSKWDGKQWKNSLLHYFLCMCQQKYAHVRKNRVTWTYSLKKACKEALAKLYSVLVLSILFSHSVLLTLQHFNLTTEQGLPSSHSFPMKKKMAVVLPKASFSCSRMGK